MVRPIQLRSLPVQQRLILVVSAGALLLLSPVLIRLFFGHHSSQPQDVKVEVIQKGTGPPVSSLNRYSSMVTLYIENRDHSKTPAGWSTRKEDGAPEDKPFEFQPGVELIEGWTEGVLQMREGERAWIHVPAAKGYGHRAMGQPGGTYYIPANSNLLFDIEIMGQAHVNNHRRNDPHHHLRALWSMITTTREKD